MAKKLTKNVTLSEVDEQYFEQKHDELIKHLKVISNGLCEFASIPSATEAKLNDLLKCCYNLEGQDLKTGEEWRALGCVIKRYEHGYLFWDNGDIILLYTRDQVRELQLSLFVL